MFNNTVIGILGGIGSGKSTVAQLFSELGCMVIAADVIAHEVLNRPDIISQLARRWGKDVVDSNGIAAREKIAEIVFNSAEQLQFFNNLIHPDVIRRCEQLLKLYLVDSNITGIVLDMPLLVEVGWDKRCDFLIFVQCPEEIRLARAQEKGKIDPDQLKKREKFQISLDKKKQISHYVVNNNSDISDIAEQVAQIFSTLKSSK